MLKRSLNIILCLCVGWSLFGQQEVHVITKKIDKAYNYREGYEVNLDGDRAEVFIEPNYENKIIIEVEIVAKHPDKKQAKEDVEKMFFMSERLKNNIYLRNYLSDEAKVAKPESQLKVIYNISVPNDCPVYVKNLYGFVSINELSNSVKVNSKFSSVSLDQITGSIDLLTRYGDILGQNLNGNVSIGSRRTNITLKDIQGTFDIDAEYGLIQIYASPGLLNLDLNADKSKVLLFNTDLEDFRYDLTSVGSDIQFPDELNFKLLHSEPNLQRFNYTPTTEFYSLIQVKVTFGSLEVNKAAKPKRP